MDNSLFSQYSMPLFDQITPILQDVFSDFSQNSNIQATPQMETLKLRHQYLNLILLKSEKLLLNYMIHYNPNNLMAITSLAFQRSLNEIDEKRVEQFVREFSNIMAGKLQLLFKSGNIHLEIGLPWVTLDIDRYFYESNKNVSQSLFRWDIRINKEILFLNTLEIQSSYKDFSYNPFKDIKGNNESEHSSFEQF